MRNSGDIRKEFIKYFENNEHVFFESSSLLPSNDQSLLFTNAGMVQFKDWFIGLEKASSTNVVSSQKCLRAGGKHNDLDNVGYTPRHHTFFEMLGNFSFGGYFKEQAIYFAWQFLTKALSLSSQKLIVTVYKGDEESLNFWKKISGLESSRIIEIASNDNFWSMGDVGPCGPCSEIFYDNGDKISGGLPGTKNQDGNRFVEIWNLVFMQHEKKEDKLINLPIKCVDTGMGLERINAVINGKTNNYDIDIFKILKNDLENLLGIQSNNQNITSFRVITDHIRAITFLISEGVLPSNEGRGYVLRRIIRRASRHLQMLGKEDKVLNKLVHSVCDQYKNFYQYLKNEEKFIVETLRYEEEKFSETLKEGLKILNDEISTLKSNYFSANLAFKLYDTYGFPVDMTENILKEKNLKINMNEFEKLMLGQKNRSKASWIGNKQTTINQDFLSKINLKECDTKFSGYENFQEITKLLKIFKDNKSYQNTKGLNDAILIFSKTPFYAESGGQIGDSGLVIDTKTSLKICDIFDTQKQNAIFFHFAKNFDSDLVVGQNFKIGINQRKRKKIQSNHTSTHLLHEVLRMILGAHVKQKGSLVSERKLRFDFTHNKPVENKKLMLIENFLNNIIRENLKVSIKFKEYKKAISEGAIGLFGEKYPSKVRVVTFKSTKKDFSFMSSELCGGTHVNYTGEIGLIKILTESSVSSGVRRIEAITGEEASIKNAEHSEMLSQLSVLLKSKEGELINKVKNLISENASLKKEKFKNQTEKYNPKNLKTINNFKLYIQELMLPSKEMKNHADKISEEIKSGIIILLRMEEKKVSIVVKVSHDLHSKITASQLVKEISIFFGGSGGGGRNDLAQGGGNDPSKIKEFNNYLNNILKH